LPFTSGRFKALTAISFWAYRSQVSGILSFVVKSIEGATTSVGPKENGLTARGCPLAVSVSGGVNEHTLKKLRI